MAGTAGIAYPLIVNYAITGAVSGGTDDYTITRPCTVIDAWAATTVAVGGARNLTIQKAAAAITNAMDLNVAINTVVRAASLDTTWWAYTAGQLLTFSVGGADAAAIRANVSVMLLPAVAYSTAIA